MCHGFAHCLSTGGCGPELVRPGGDEPLPVTRADSSRKDRGGRVEGKRKGMEVEAWLASSLWQAPGLTGGFDGGDEGGGLCQGG